MTRWIADHLGPDVPLHFTAFHPDYKMTDVAATPPATLRRAREIALRQRPAPRLHRQRARREGGTTFCPGCAQPLIERDWHEYPALRSRCGWRRARGLPALRQRIAGRFGASRRRSAAAASRCGSRRDRCPSNTWLCVPFRLRLRTCCSEFASVANQLVQQATSPIAVTTFSAGWECAM